MWRPLMSRPRAGVVVEDDDAPIVERRIVRPAPTIETETIVQPAPERRIIRHRATTTQVRLTTRQRHDVLRTVRDERPARTVTERVDYRVGAALPASVPVYAMPQQVIYEAPALRGYDYTMVGDRMLRGRSGQQHGGRRTRSTIRGNSTGPSRGAAGPFAFSVGREQRDAELGAAAQPGRWRGTSGRA